MNIDITEKSVVANVTQKVTSASISTQVGPQGAPGNGPSAYEVAVDNGFVGSEAAWLASLVGPAGADGNDGTDGDNGLSAYEVAVQNSFIGTELQWLASLEGPQGVRGLNWIGPYSNLVTYAVNDGVSYNGSSYINIQAGTGHLPTDIVYWNILAAKGSDGNSGGNPGGTDGQIQYALSGVFAADSGLIYDPVTKRLIVGGGIRCNGDFYRTGEDYDGYFNFRDQSGHTRSRVNLVSGALETSTGGVSIDPSSSSRGFTLTGIDLITNDQITWRNGAYGSIDTGFSRDSAGVVVFGDGSARGNSSGKAKMTSLILKAPNGVFWELTVSNSGVLTTTSI